LLERALLGDVYQDSDLIFCREDGAPLRPTSISRRAVSLAKAAKVPPIRCHDLRHTAATVGLAAGIPGRVMQERLGHGSIAITLGTYSHVLPEMDAAAADRIAEVAT
jgi:integrase